MSDDEFLAELEAGTLPEHLFPHSGHVRAAWLYLKRFPITEAIARFSDTLRSYATIQGKPERYHATITWAYLLLINERILHAARSQTWDEFAAAHPDLLDWRNSILLKYYRKETLQSDLARNVFIMPDRAL